MSLDTFSELKTAVQSWINKSSISASANDFIVLAEAFLNQELRTRQMEAIATGTITANPLDLTALTRYLAVRSLSISVGGGDVVLNYISEDLRQARFSATTSGIPQYYSITGTDLYLDPAPNDEYSYSLKYRQSIEALSDSNTSNWVLAAHPNLYLYAALTEAAIFAKDQEAAMGYIALRDRYMLAVKKADIKDRSGGTSRMITETAVV